jgi:hypothetical protein
MRCNALEVFLASQNVAAELAIEAAGGCDDQRASGTVQQLNAQGTLQFLHMLARRRLADAIHGGASAEAVSLGDVPEKL